MRKRKYLYIFFIRILPIADKITSLREKRDISKYRLSQLSGISQSSLGRIMAQENLPSLITLEKICTALGVTLSQFFQEGNSENLTEKTEKSSRDMERSEYK